MLVLMWAVIVEGGAYLVGLELLPEPNVWPTAEDTRHSMAKR